MRVHVVRVPYDAGNRGVRMGKGPERLGGADRLRSLGADVTEATVEASTRFRAEIGTTFASCVITFPTVCAHMLGQLMKYMGPRRIVFGSDSLWYGAPQWQIEAFWRFQIPEAMAKKYGYPQFTVEDKRRILGLNSAELYKVRTSVGAYKAIPADYERRVPDRLKATLNFPGHSRPGSDRGDKLSRLREDYLAAGGHPSNRRYGWIRRA